MIYKNINDHISEICQYDILVTKYPDSCRYFCKYDSTIYPQNAWEGKNTENDSWQCNVEKYYSSASIYGKVN